MWEYAGMARNSTGLEKAIGQIQDLRDDFNKNLLVPGSGDQLNAELERAGRVRDFWILVNCFAGMLWKETSPVVGISARSTRRKTEKLPETMRISPMQQSGNTKVRESLRHGTRKNLSMTMSNLRFAVTSEEI